MKYFELDKEEQRIEKAFEQGKLVSVPGLEKEKKRYRESARFSLAKTKNINIRISEKVLLKLKAIAAREGIPYQTLAGSIIHKHTLAPSY